MIGVRWLVNPAHRPTSLLKFYFGHILEYDERVLRVIVKKDTDPLQIITFCSLSHKTLTLPAS